MFKVSNNFNIKLKWGLRSVFILILGEFAFYGIFRCPFAVPYVSCESCPVIQCPGRKYWIPIWIGILISAIIVGRAFCAYACPAGTISDLLSKLNLFKIKIKRNINKVLSFGKYIVLIVSLYYLVVLSNPRWAIPVRTGDFYNSIGLTFEHANFYWITRTLVVFGIILLSLVISNAWCRYFCPTGGILDIFNQFAIFKYRKTEKCNNCNDCKAICSMDTRPNENDCTNCGDCNEICPVDAIKYGRK